MDNKQKIIEAVKSVRTEIARLKLVSEKADEESEQFSRRLDELIMEANELGITKEELK